MMKSKEVNYSSWKEWNPKDYLTSYFSKLGEEEKITLDFIISRFKKIKKSRVALEFGCGPVLAQALAISPHVSEIHLADYLTINLKEIKKWINKDPEAFSWELFTEYILKKEGANPTKSKIINRENDLRKKIKRLSRCDAYHFPPFKNPPFKYPIVLSIFCADSATTSKILWKRYMRNIFRMVAKGGDVILMALRKANYYKIKDRFFPCVYVDEYDIINIMENIGYKKSDIYLTVNNVPSCKPFGFKSIISLHAKAPN